MGVCMYHIIVCMYALYMHVCSLTHTHTHPEGNNGEGVNIMMANVRPSKELEENFKEEVSVHEQVQVQCPWGGGEELA